MNLHSATQLPDHSPWLDTVPAALADLRGRPVVLAFVNAASAWCAQRLAELAHWQRRHPGRAQVLVVQVPRFDFERGPAAALKLLRRQGVSAPMLLDADWSAWRRFGVRAWPTVVLLDARGIEQARVAGLDPPGRLERALGDLIADAGYPPQGEASGELHPEPGLALRFPTGLAVSEERLYIADSGHHRILECTHGGRIVRQFGHGRADLLDGPASEAAFQRPQGLALDRHSLYVADTGNHALRRINLLTGQVDSLCGNGRPGVLQAGPVEQPRLAPLDHPIGLALAQNQLHISMAGDNRLWRYDLGERSLRWVAGSGALAQADGPVDQAAFAQPTAVAAAGHVLYVLDALGSSLRSVHLHGGMVQTVIGQGPWAMGEGGLQFPQALALDPATSTLWIADAGNGVLRSTRIGSGELQAHALPRRLCGAAGVAAGAGAVWVADTDAHAVLRLDADSGVLSEIPIYE